MIKNFLQRLKNRFAAIPEFEHRVFRQIFNKKHPTFKQIKYVGRFLTIQEKRVVVILTCLTLFSFILLIGRFWFFNLQAKPISGGTYIEGTISEPKFVNPLLASDDIDLDLSRLIFSGLLEYDKNLELKPDLAENISVSQDKKQYTVCLKKNIYWHDGEKLTPEDILFTFNLAQNDISKSQFKSLIKESGAQQLDENCVQFKLKNPSDAFMSALTLGILPKHIWQNVTQENFSQSEFNLRPIGSGPFQFKSLTQDRSNVLKAYTLERNEKFYGHVANLQEITFKIYSDFNQAAEALKNQEIIGLGYAPKKIRDEVAGLKNIKHYPLNLPYYTVIFFNLKDQNSPLKDKAVREALAYLTPKNQIFKDVLNEEGQIIDSAILPFSSAYNPNITKYGFNPSLAEKTLTQAGWQKNQRGIFEKKGQELEITLTTVDQPDLATTAKLIQTAWQDIGIKIKSITISPDQIAEVIKARNFQSFLYGVLANSDSDPYFLWHSSQIAPPGLNLSGFNNRKADELLEKAEKTKGNNLGKKYWGDFQEIIAENIPAVFLYNTTYSYLVDKKIKGIDINYIHRPSDRFINIENWYIKTKMVWK
ncbi:MAG: ABC transporter substrate-binding protein [Patescibacteria group bacterium]|jgi:peptide/nickel transport system substrate-binding protein